MKKLVTILIILFIVLLTTSVYSEVMEVYKWNTEYYTSSEEVEIIVTTFYDDDYTSLVKITANMDKGDILRIKVMSPGGNALVCLGIANHILKLKQKGIYIITESSGLTASAAAVLWLTGDEREVTTGDLFMFHGAVIYDFYGRVMSRKDLPGDIVFVLDEVDRYERKLILDITKSADLVFKLMGVEGNKGDSNQHWFTAEEMMDMGLATKLTETIKGDIPEPEVIEGTEIIESVKEKEEEIDIDINI